MITYAQNFEDVMLARMFTEKERGFYVDIGASHPENLSVTKHFYDLGWSGVNVEPIKSNYDKFLVDRPRDLNINAAVGSVIGPRKFFEVQGFNALSTFDPEQAAYLKSSGYSIEEYFFEVVTANSIFERIESSRDMVDFLKIDVEGMEREVLESLDLTKYRPRVLVIEATSPAKGFPGWENFISVAKWYEWEHLVLIADYIFAHFDGISRFYVRREDANLVERFKIPPGYFDQIHTKTSVSDRTNLLLARAESEARLNLIHELEEKLQFTQADNHSRLNFIHNLEEKLEFTKVDSQARLELIHDLEEKLEFTKVDSQARLELIHDLEKKLQFTEADSDARLKQIHDLENKLQFTQTDSGARLELIHDIEEKLRFTEGDSQARLELIQDLENKLNLLRTKSKHDKIDY